MMVLAFCAFRLNKGVESSMAAFRCVKPAVKLDVCFLCPSSPARARRVIDDALTARRVRPCAGSFTLGKAVDQ